MQIAEACDSWRQPADNAQGTSTATNIVPQLPFWLLARSDESTQSWKALPLTSWAQVTACALCWGSAHV